MENIIQECLEELLKGIDSPFKKIKIETREDNSYRVNIESLEPSLLIGRHGDNIMALQNILRLLVYKKSAGQDINITLDVDDYRKRQEDNVIQMAERKVDMARRTQETQSLPPMSPYFRKVIHLYLSNEKFLDIMTESVGEGDLRYLTIKPKVV